MFRAQREPIDSWSYRYTLTGGSGALTFADVLRCWVSDGDFRQFYADLLAEVPFQAFRWEAPYVDNGRMDRPFEFAVVNAPELDVPADPHTFAAHFAGAGKGPGWQFPDHATGESRAIVTFSNLGGDAFLLAPAPMGPVDAYSHLAAFVRGAPRRQVHALWTAMARAICKRLSQRPLWLSTAGSGVAWLHVRLDASPKYYRCAQYRNEFRGFFSGPPTRE